MTMRPLPDSAIGVRMGSIDISPVLNDQDKDYFQYHPTSVMEQAQIASQYFQELSTPNQYLHKTKQAVALMDAVGTGSRTAKAQFLEALSYDDFNYIMQDTIYRKMLEKWAIPDSPFESFAKEIKVPTMQRPGKMFTLDGIETPIPLVHPGEEPRIRYPYDSGIAIRPYKYMAQVELLWETLVEDDLNALSDIPDRLSNAIKTTLGRIYTGLWAKNTGFRDALGEPFNELHNDKILNPTLDPNSDVPAINNTLQANMENFGTPKNAAFSLPALQAARTQMAKFLSPDGNPIDVRAVHLVIGQGLAEVARNVLNAQSYVMERAGGIPGQDGGPGFVRMEARRDAVNGITLHVDPYLHVVVENGFDNKMWMLTADKNIARPLFAYCLLAGYEQPIIQRRVPNWRGVGGRDNDKSVDWISTGFRCGFIRGTQWGDARGAIVSTGQGA